MIQWQPIDLDEVQVGDRISYVNYNNGYTVTEIDYVRGAKKFCIDFGTGRSYWYPAHVFRYTENRRVEYDPEQQPWDEDDV